MFDSTNIICYLFVSQCWRMYNYTIIKVRDLGVILENFQNFYDHITAILYRIRNLLPYDACSTIIHVLNICRLVYYNYIMNNVPMSKTD